MSQFHVYLDTVINAHLALCLNSVLNVKAVVAAFNQEKALVGAFSVITNLRMDLLEALLSRLVQLLGRCPHQYPGCHNYITGHQAHCDLRHCDRVNQLRQSLVVISIITNQLCTLPVLMDGDCCVCVYFVTRRPPAISPDQTGDMSVITLSDWNIRSIPPATSHYQLHIYLQFYNAIYTSIYSISRIPATSNLTWGDNF